MGPMEQISLNGHNFLILSKNYSKIGPHVVIRLIYIRTK